MGGGGQGGGEGGGEGGGKGGGGEGGSGGGAEVASTYTSFRLRSRVLPGSLSST